jgi:predicted nucleic acid-binding protein
MATIEPAPPLVVCDAGLLIHLDEMESIDLLADFPRVMIAGTVLDEVMRHRSRALTQMTFDYKICVPLRPAPPAVQTAATIFGLHAGEIESLELALEHRAGMFFTDDTAARLAARHLGLRTHGTIGIIVRAIRRRLRTKQQVLAVLRALPQQSSLHLKRSLLDRVLAEVSRNVPNGAD